MNTIPAKTILTTKKDRSWFGIEYNMNLYKGCCHGCIYCDSRSDCYQIQDFDTVRAKENAIRILSEELRKKQRTGVIGTGSMSDPYNPFEKTHQLTRQALALIQEYYFGIAIATKSSLITRDIDLLKQISSHAPVLCKITVTAIDDELSRKLEPKVSVTSHRLAAIRELSDAGIFTGVLMMPLLLDLTDTTENVRAIIHQAAACGARFIYPMFGLTLRNGGREYFYQKLVELFPEQNLKQAYVQRYGNSYECHSPTEMELHQLFTEECTKLGILYHMDDIIAAYHQGYEYQQLSLFQ